MDLSGEAAVDEVAHHRVADLALLVGGADHGDRAWLHQPAHRCEDLLARVGTPGLDRLRRQQDPDVRRDRTVRSGDDRIEVDLRDLREVRDQLGDPPDLLGQCPPVHRRSTPNPAQDLGRADRVEHRQRLVRTDRGQAEGDVLEHLHQHTAEPEGHDLPERRVGDRADDDLLAGRHQLLHLHTVDPRVRRVRPHVLDDALERGTHLNAALHPDDDTAGIRLVQHIGGDDLQYDRSAEPVREGHRLVDVLCQLLARHCDPVRIGDDLALGCGECTASGGPDGVEQRPYGLAVL